MTADITGPDRMQKLPMVSIITVTLNAAATLERTLRSVIAQDYPAIEHVIIDGGSTDGTLELIERYREHVAILVTEPDKGISDAFNKGISRSHGEYLGILSADDALTPGAITRSATRLREQPAVGFVFGHSALMRDGHQVTVNYGDSTYATRIGYRMPCLNHSTMLVRRGVHDRLGLYDLRYRLAMDYDFVLRIHRQDVRGLLVDAIQTQTNLGGLSDRHWRDAYREVRDISVAQGCPVIPAYTRFAVHLTRGLATRALRGLGLTIVISLFRRLRHRLVRY